VILAFRCFHGDGEARGFATILELYTRRVSKDDGNAGFPIWRPGFPTLSLHCKCKVRVETPLIMGKGDLTWDAVLLSQGRAEA
jgi:hypothetical protein